MPFLSHIAAALFFALSGSGLLVGAGALAKCAPDIAKKVLPAPPPEPRKPHGLLDALDSPPANRAGRLGARFCGKGENCEPESEDNQGEGDNAPRLSPLNPSDQKMMEEILRRVPSHVRDRKMDELILESRRRQTNTIRYGVEVDYDYGPRIPFTPDGANRNRMRREWIGADFQRTTGGANRDDLDELDELDEAGEHSTE